MWRAFGIINYEALNVGDLGEVEFLLGLEQLFFGMEFCGAYAGGRFNSFVLLFLRAGKVHKVELYLIGIC